MKLHELLSQKTIGTLNDLSHQKTPKDHAAAVEKIKDAVQELAVAVTKVKNYLLTQIKKDESHSANYRDVISKLDKILISLGELSKMPSSTYKDVVPMILSINQSAQKIGGAYIRLVEGDESCLEQLDMMMNEISSFLKSLINE